MSSRLVLLLVLFPVRLVAQERPAERLKPANGVLTMPFVPMTQNVELTNPRAVHELSNGNLLVVDPAGRRVLVAKFGTKAFDSVLGIPPAFLTPLAGDTSLVWSMSRGWFFLSGGKPVGMLPMTNPVVASLHQINGADRFGRVLTVVYGKKATDSARVYLISRETADSQLVTKLWVGGAALTGPRPVCRVYESPLLTVDGWIAVLRTNPYRVDWRTPEGKWQLGAPIPMHEVPMNAQNKEAYIEWRRRELLNKHDRGTPPVDSTVVWPRTVCPWTGGYPPIATQDGKLAIYRTPTADAPGTTYDIVDRSGKLVKQIELAANATILAFGQKSVFIVVNTDSATAQIERHPWP